MIARTALASKAGMAAIDDRAAAVVRNFLWLAGDFSRAEHTVPVMLEGATREWPP
jgi:hypothetical protein